LDSGALGIGRFEAIVEELGPVPMCRMVRSSWLTGERVEESTELLQACTAVSLVCGCDHGEAMLVIVEAVPGERHGGGSLSTMSRGRLERNAS
jgi:hypothetical protein